MIGLVIECATEHAEVAVVGSGGETLAHEREDLGHGHTRRLTPLVDRALHHAGRTPAEVTWIAADLGPGSFTGVRVGLATASALSLASGARLVGASSLEALAKTSGVQRGLVVPLVGAGRRDVYAGWYRAAGGVVRLMAAPQVGRIESVIEQARDALGALSGGDIRFVGPGAGRERDALESSFAGSTSPAWRFEGLSALDLAAVTRPEDAPAPALAVAHAPTTAASSAESLRPLYVRPAQAEEKVRRRALAADPPRLRPLVAADIPAVVAIERRVFSDPWTANFFLGELAQPHIHARLAEVNGAVAGYCFAWLGAGEGHLGNLAVVPEHRRRGVARALLEDLLPRARQLGVERLALEVRTSNFAAQWLYGAHGFRLAGLRRRYYRDNQEDALILEWRANAASRPSNLE